MGFIILDKEDEKIRRKRISNSMKKYWISLRGRKQRIILSENRKEYLNSLSEKDKRKVLKNFLKAGLHKSEATRKKSSEAVKRFRATEEGKKHTLYMKKRWRIWNSSDAAKKHRKRHSKKLKAFFKTDKGIENRKRHSKFVKKWARTHLREFRKNGRKRFEGENGLKIREEMSKQAKMRMKTPEGKKWRKDQSDRIKAFYKTSKGKKRIKDQSREHSAWFRSIDGQEWVKKVSGSKYKTSLEKRVQSILKKMGLYSSDRKDTGKIRYTGSGSKKWWHWDKNNKCHRCPDFKVNGRKKIIEVTEDLPHWGRVYSEYAVEQPEIWKNMGYSCLVINGREWSSKKIKRKIRKFIGKENGN